jgi:subtilisin-like proprotein convertase family protein
MLGCQSGEDRGIELANSSGLDSADAIEVLFSQDRDKFWFPCEFEPGCDLVLSLTPSESSTAQFKLVLKNENNEPTSFYGQFDESGTIKVGFPHLVNNIKPGFHEIRLTSTEPIEGLIRAEWEVAGTFGCSKQFSDGADCECYCPEDTGCQGSLGNCIGAFKNDLVYDNDIVTPIPDNDQNGVDGIIYVKESASVAKVMVELNVTHSVPSELDIELRHGDKAWKVWDNLSAYGSITQTFQTADFEGLDSKGNWVLHLVDSSSRDKGKLNTWRLTITPAYKEVLDSPPPELVFENTIPTKIPDDKPSGVDNIIFVPQATEIAYVDVIVNLSHTSKSDLYIVLYHEDTKAIVWNRWSYYNDLKKTFQLIDFEGQDSYGNWILHLVDQSGRDVGTLNSWNLIIYPVVATTRATEPFEQDNKIPADIVDDLAVDSIIYVSKEANIGTMTVTLNLEHRSPSDLLIDLIHNNTTHRIWNHDSAYGGITQTFQLSAFDLMPAEGIWRLHILDNRDNDTGVLKSWSINITPDVE